MITLPLLALSLACDPGASEPPALEVAKADRITIVYSSRVDGELEPCG